MAEEMKNGVISEEALEQVAGGLKIAGREVSPETLKKALIGAGVVVTAAVGATTIGVVGKKKGWFSKKATGEIDPMDRPPEDQPPIPPTPPTPEYLSK